MKFSPLLLVGSLAVNAALLGYYVSNRASAADAAGSSSASADASSGASAPKRNSSAKTRDAATAGNTWAQLNTSDLSALAARLRAAGFPESVVRSVVGAQIAESFKERRAALIPEGDEKPFWSTETSWFGFGYDPKLFSAIRELGREQSKLMKEILGENPEASEQVSDFRRRRFGDFTSDKIELIQRIDEDYNELRNEVTAASRGILLPEDRQKLALLENEKRADLAQVLSPTELEDYLMRTSRTTSQLRRSLGLMNATESEFRAIYAAQSAFDEKYSYQVTGMGSTPEFAKEREGAQKLAYEQIKGALGDQRYTEYLRVSDREFQQLTRIAQQGNVPEPVALQVYNLRDNVSKESNRIFADTALTNDQKREALKSLAGSARTQINAALGPEVGANYQKVAERWLGGIERGGAVSFSETGQTRTKSVPRTPPAGQRPADAPMSPGGAPAAQTPAK